MRPVVRGCSPHPGRHVRREREESAPPRTHTQSPRRGSPPLCKLVLGGAVWTVGRRGSQRLFSSCHPAPAPPPPPSSSFKHNHFSFSSHPKVNKPDSSTTTSVRANCPAPWVFPVRQTHRAAVGNRLTGIAPGLYLWFLMGSPLCTPASLATGRGYAS